jgi:hypothetical protein
VGGGVLRLERGGRFAAQKDIPKVSGGERDRGKEMGIRKGTAGHLELPDFDEKRRWINLAPASYCVALAASRVLEEEGKG